MRYSQNKIELWDRHLFFVNLFRKNRCLSQSTGFTLIELIVTVTIAAILLSLILPALSRTRESGRRIACVNNLRQIYTAFTCYVEDNNERFFWGTPTTVPPESDAMDWYIWGGTTNTLYTGPQDPIFRVNYFTFPSTGITRELRVLNKYVDNNLDVFRCPSDKGRSDVYVFGAKSLYECVGNSYAFNSWGGAIPGAGLNGLRFSNVRTPSKTILFCDTDGAGGSLSDTNTYWHNPQGSWRNVCYVDGHIKFVKISSGLSGTDPNGTEWSWAP